MIFGVPIAPLTIACMIFALCAVYISLSLIALLIPVVYVMKIITKKDDMIFRLVGFWARFITNPLSKRFYGAKTFNAVKYEKQKLSKFGLPRISILTLNQNPSFEKFIPYEVQIQNIVITKNYEFLATWQLNGAPFEIESSDDIASYKNILHAFLKSFIGEKISFYFHNCRVSIKDKLNGKFDNNFLSTLDKSYYEGLNKYSLKENKLFLTAIYSPFDRIAKSNLQKAAIDKPGKRNAQIIEKISIMERFCVGIEASLAPFGIRRLKSYEFDGKTFSEQLEFYNYLISGEFKPVRKLNSPIYAYLKGNLNSIMFSQNTAQINFNDGRKKFAKAIEFQDYPSESHTGIFDELMYFDTDYTITQSFTPVHRIEAKAQIKSQRKKLISSEDDSSSQIEEIAVALDELTRGDLGFGKYHFSLVLYANTKEELEKKVNSLMSRLNNQGFQTAQANIAFPATYFGQFPANFGLRPRIHTISTKNYASLVSLHNFLRGKRDANPWGDAVTMFRTPNGQPYFFNFHETDENKDVFGDMALANTLILGKSGSGKTALMSFLFDQLVKFADPQTFPADIPMDKRKFSAFYLDKDKGAIGNILAAGGKYITINAGQSTGFNPFMIDNTPDNLRNLKILMKMLVTRNGEILSTSEEEGLNRAVDSIIRDFTKEERKHGISLLDALLTEKGETNSLKSRLRLWCKGQKFGWVFDNETDNFKFDEDTQIYGIDGTDLLKDKEISGVVSFYILWRLFSLTDGRRFVLSIDEAWDWILNKTVADAVFDKEKTIRKQNGFLILGTQSVEDFAKSPIARAIIEQSATVVILSNDKAQRSDYVEALNLSEEAYYFAKETNKLDYLFLTIKDQTHKAIATMDLSFLDKRILKILSTGKAYVNPIEEILKKNLSPEENLKELYALYN